MARLRTGYQLDPRSDHDQVTNLQPIGPPIAFSVIISMYFSFVILPKPKTTEYLLEKANLVPIRSRLEAQT